MAVPRSRYRRHEGVESMLTDLATAKTILRDYISATIGFT
jgi:hypothetical protein